MNETFTTLPETVFESTSECICSPASEDGNTLSNSQTGPKIEKSGQEVVLVSRSRRRESNKEKLIRDICGLKCDDLSPSAVLGRYSVNRSPASWGDSGLLEYVSILRTLRHGAVSTKICTKCRKKLPLGDFRKYWGASSDGLRPICKICQRTYEAHWRTNNKARLVLMRIRRAEKEKTYRLEYDAKNRGRLLALQAGRRAHKRGIPFDLDTHLDEIEIRMQHGICELTGIPLDFYTTGQRWNSPSLDRIEPKMGYLYSNIRVVCFAMNAALGNWGENTLRELMSVWLDRR